MDRAGGRKRTPARVLVSWSSGKDCAWALHTLRRDPSVEVVGLLVTVNVTHDRVAMHATRRALLEAQAAALGLPLHIVPLPWPCPNEVYEREMRVAALEANERGVTYIAFGDLLIEEIRSYRAVQLGGTGVDPIFPLWGEPTGRLARRIIDAGVDAVVTCIDTKSLSSDLVGRRFDASFLRDLPEGVDPCGENGEFHTIVLDGPMFAAPIDAARGEVVKRGEFVFIDLIPA